MRATDALNVVDDDLEGGAALAMAADIWAEATGRNRDEFVDELEAEHQEDMRDEWQYHEMMEGREL